MSLGDAPGDNPSDLATLDLLEEIVHHTLAAGHVDEAWDVYWNRIGGYQNLLWRLGAYERGERICRAFAGGRPPEDAPLPEGLPELGQAMFVNEWGLYLENLGRLAAAAHCYERATDLMMRSESWKNGSIDNQNLTDVRLLAGRVTAASEAAEEALRLAERADDAEQRSGSYAYRAHARALRGETAGALADFRAALRWQNEDEKEPDRPLWSLRGVQHTLLLARLGRNEEATHLTEANKRVCIDIYRTENQDNINIVLADLARQRHDLAAARQLLDAAHEWAIARDAKEPLCWAALVRARLERAVARGSPAADRPDGALCAPYYDARRALDDGLRIARDCGFGIYHVVDLLLLRARLALEEGDADQAIADVDVALFHGVLSPEESGLPELLAATDPECGYAWGEAEGRQLRGEALLLRAARRLGSSDFAPARFAELPEEVRGLVGEAREELEACRGLREKIEDPKVAETEDVLAQLDGGVLTRHPLEPVVVEEPTPAPVETSSSAKKRKKAMAKKKHVFLSYVRESSADVERLRHDLIGLGEDVWWDRDIPPGVSWKLEVRQALKDAYAFVLCLSKDLEGRDVSGASPEIRDAIAVHRQRAPRSTFIFPVRLSECEVPSFEIDSTTMLGDLQRVDLFSAKKRRGELRRLVKAFRACPGHP